MIRTDYSKSSVTYKFILYKMKMLVTDNRGRLRYLESLDNIFFDVFGIKNTMKKINNAYDPREISSLIDNLGVNILLQLFNSGKMYKILEDLVQINYRMNVLKKDIRKQSRKDKRDKDDVKEYNYLVDLYKKTIKYIRNKFGIKNTKTSYKRKYQSLSNIVKNKGYGDYWDDDDDESFTSILMRDDDFYFGDWDDDDDDDFDDSDSTSTLDDFVKMLHQEQGLSPRKSQRRKYHDVIDDDDDDNLSMFDDDDYSYTRKRYLKKDEYEELPPSIDDGLHEQIADLTDAVADISSAIQHLLMKDEYNSVQRKRDIALRDDLNRQLMHMEKMENDESLNVTPSRTNDTIPPIRKEVEILTSLVGKIQKDQTRFRDDQKTLAESLDYLINMMGEFAQKQDILAHALFDDEEDVDDEETSFSRPIVRDDDVDDNAIIQKDRYYEVDDEEEPLSREELIDLINAANSSENTTTIEATQTSIKMETKPVPEDTDVIDELP